MVSKVSHGHDNGWLAMPEVSEAVEHALRRRRVPAREVEDLRQTTLLRAMQAREVPHDVGMGKALVRTIARSVAADYFRSGQTRARHNAGPCGNPDEHAHESEWDDRHPVDARRQIECIERAVAEGRLRPGDVRILTRTAEGLSPAEIALEMGVPPQSVRNKLVEIRKVARASWALYVAAAAVAVAALLVWRALLGAVDRGASSHPAPHVPNGMSHASPARPNVNERR